MWELITLPFRLVWTAITVVWNIVWGVVSLAFGVVGGIISLALGVALLGGLIALLVRVFSGKSEKHAYHDDGEPFISYYDKDAVK